MDAKERQAECDKFFIVAGLAPNSEKTMLESSAFQTLFKFLSNLCRKALSVLT